MALERYWRDQHEKIGNTYFVWRWQADELLAVVDILLPHFHKRLRSARPSSLSDPIHLLRGCAVETLLKGRAIRRGHRFVVGGKFRAVPNTGTGHDLVLLADETGFLLNDAERDLLERLSPRLELGRYPIGKDWRKGLKKFPPGGYVSNSFYSSADEPIFARLIKRLRCAVPRQ